MIGQSVLRKCLLDPGIERVQTIGRSGTGLKHAKLAQIIHADLLHYAEIEAELAGLDACLFCLGVTSAGMPEADYQRVTYGITMAAAETLSRLNPGMTFLFVSGAGADSSEKGRAMWARVKGKTENGVLRLPFRDAYVIRPAAILPTHEERSRTAAYRVGYTLMRPVFPPLRRLFPGYILTTEELGRAMVLVAKRGAAKKILESSDIRDYIRQHG